MEELRYTHKAELKEQYLQIHNDIGDEVLMMKRKHKLENIKWMVSHDLLMDLVLLVKIPH